MPGREIPLITGEIYHIFNRGINSQTIFESDKDFYEVLRRTKYYQNQNPPMRYSQFNDFSLKTQGEFFKKFLEEQKYLIRITAFCFMPNHFHFILKQCVKEGISKFISNLTNSYTRYFNVKNKRFGPIFQGKFKAVLIKNDEQLCHLSRYIHLNPFLSFLIKDINDLQKYPYSSLPEYLGKISVCFSEPDLVLSQFSDKAAYYKFILDQADYQQGLEIIKKLLIEELTG